MRDRRPLVATGAIRVSCRFSVKQCSLLPRDRSHSRDRSRKQRRVKFNTNNDDQKYPELTKTSPTEKNTPPSASHHIDMTDEVWFMVTIG